MRTHQTKFASILTRRRLLAVAGAGVVGAATSLFQRIGDNKTSRSAAAGAARLSAAIHQQFGRDDYPATSAGGSGTPPLPSFRRRTSPTCNRT